MDEIKLAKSILESKGYRVHRRKKSLPLKEAIAKLTPEEMNNPSEVPSLRKMARRAVDQEEKLKREASEKASNREFYAKYTDEYISSFIDKVNAADDKISEAFDLLVPSDGPAATLAGELVRATMRLLYRDYNDGDVFYEGYGLETCAPSAMFIMRELPETSSILEKAALSRLTEERYTKSLKSVASFVIQSILDNTEKFFVVNKVDSLDTPIDEMKYLVPTYDFELYLPPSVLAHLDAGHITEDDILWEVESWDDMRGAKVSMQEGHIYIENLDRDSYDQLSETADQSMDFYADYLDEEYGSTEDEDYDDEDDEE